MNGRDYVELLQLRKMKVDVRGPWGMSGHSTRRQGWKLHISATPGNASEVLDLVASFLHGSGVPFKFARNEKVLRSLNEGGLGETQVGKFITVYPATDGQSDELAQVLARITHGFEGPQVITDVQLGTVVYSRYGAFNPEVRRDRLGHVISVIALPDGSEVRDSYSIPFSTPPGVRKPFTEALLPPHEVNDMHAQKGTLFGPGYLLVDILKRGPKGRVFLALDARRQKESCLRVIKEGRRHCLSDSYRRDIRNRLLKQEHLHQTLHRHIRVPRVEQFFELNGNAYLVLDFVPGRDFESFARRGNVRLGDRNSQLRALLDLLSQIQQLHGLGYVHRDLAPSNVRVDHDGRVWILDLELSHYLNDSEAPFTLGTPGFMSPQQENGERPDVSDDVFSFGSLALFMLSGIDPRQFPRGDELDRTERLSAVTNTTHHFCEVLAACLSEQPTSRPELSIIKGSLCRELSQPSNGSGRLSVARISRVVAAAIGDAIDGLLHDTLRDEETQLWISKRGPITHRKENLEDYSLFRSTNRGVAGVVYLLSRCARVGYESQAAKLAIARATDWLLAHHETPDDQLPGLHFGEAGVAVALAEAVRSKSILPGPWLDEYLVEALTGPLDWPDLTHGAAGQGIAALACGDLLEKPKLSLLANRCAAYLVDRQLESGAWELPAGVDGLAGVRYTGFAHGTAGIVYFLADYWSRFGGNCFDRAWRRGAEWLVAQSRPGPEEGSLRWPTREAGNEYWMWWCHGAPGIALAFLKLYELTGEVRYSDVAKGALTGLAAYPRHPNLSQCHGLSGLGEIALEGARVLQDEELLARANGYAHLLLALARRSTTGSLVWSAEDPSSPTADLMLGASGVVHLLLRLSAGMHVLGVPLGV